MKLITWNTQLFQFDSVEKFTEEFALSEKDMIVATKRSYDSIFGKLNLPCQTLFQNEFGTGEPTDIMAEAMMKRVADADVKRIIAVGGGSVIDVAKVLAVSKDETIDELYDKAPNFEKRRELVIVPTTCGTGSEVTNISILNRTRIGTKMGLVGEALFADSAVLIPSVLESLPFSVFATSSIDALVHSVESALSPKATPVTKLLSYKAIDMIVSGYKEVREKGKDVLPSLLSDFLLASTYAGFAFGSAGCAAVHALSYPFGGNYHVPHGESNYVMFTGVLKEYSLIREDGELIKLKKYLAEKLECSEDQVYDELDRLLGSILKKKSLSEYNVTKEDLDVFTDIVMNTQGRLMGNNFVPLSKEQVRSIYEKLY
ncbi:4-hydroxybutyrate dehydrogenase [Guggenheimella bovis]